METRILEDRLHTERIFRVNGINRDFHGYEHATTIFHGDRRLSGRVDKTVRQSSFEAVAVEKRTKSSVQFINDL
jgi:hypothetical protein